MKENRGKMFVTVLHGEKEEGIFNPFCRCVALLATIKEKCNYVDETEIDLSDENGNVKNLRDTPDKYASEFLGERERFVLLRVERQDNDMNFVPLLKDETLLNETFMSRLASKNNRSESKRSRSSGKKTPTNKPPPSKTQEKETKTRKQSIQSNAPPAKVAPRSKSRVK